jgi:hypothetical protein
MCDPVSLAIGQLVVGIGSSFMQFQAQQQAFEQQEALYAANQRNALMAFEEKNKSTNMRIAQEMQAASEQRFDASLEAKAARSTNMAAADSMGIYGNSVDALLMDIMSAEDRTIGRINTNQDWNVGQLETVKRGQSFEAVDRINSVQRGQKPNFLALGLGIANAGLGAGTSYYQMKRA